MNRPSVPSQWKLSALKQRSQDAERMRLNEPGKKSMACTVKSNSHGLCYYKLPKSMKPEGAPQERMPIFIHCQKVFWPIKRENWYILVLLVSVVKIWEEWVWTPHHSHPYPLLPPSVPHHLRPTSPTSVSINECHFSCSWLDREEMGVKWKRRGKADAKYQSDSFQHEKPRRELDIWADFTCWQNWPKWVHVSAINVT